MKGRQQKFVSITWGISVALPWKMTCEKFQDFALWFPKLAPPSCSLSTGQCGAPEPFLDNWSQCLLCQFCWGKGFEGKDINPFQGSATDGAAGTSKLNRTDKYKANFQSKENRPTTYTFLHSCISTWTARRPAWASCSWSRVGQGR